MDDQRWRVEIAAALRQYFGHSHFRGDQEAAILAALNGAGKSLCFMLPAVVTGKLTVVISPLLALMRDMEERLRYAGVPAAYLASDLDQSVQLYLMACLKDNLSMRNTSGYAGSGTDATLKVLFVTPEKLETDGFRTTLEMLYSKGQLGLFAVDEAHCIHSWGQSFRPSYLELGFLRQAMPGVPIMALTATATEQVQGFIVQQLRLHNPLVLRCSLNRPELTYSVINIDSLALWNGPPTSQCTTPSSQPASNAVGSSGPLTQQGKEEEEEDPGVLADVAHVEEYELQQARDHLKRLIKQYLKSQWVFGCMVRMAAMHELERLLKQHIYGPQDTICGCAIVYVRKREHADGLVEILKQVPFGRALRCAAYHAKLVDETKHDVIKEWRERRLDLVVASIAFGMGIDRPDVRLVVHWSIVQTVEGYMQESGRAARDGNSAHAVMFYSIEDRDSLEFLLEEAEDRAVNRLELHRAGKLKKAKKPVTQAQLEAKVQQAMAARHNLSKMVTYALGVEPAGTTPPGSCGALTGTHSCGALTGTHSCGALTGTHSCGALAGTHRCGALTGTHSCGALAGAHSTPGTTAAAYLPLCRRRFLLSHFDEVLVGECQACDNCIAAAAASRGSP